MKNLTIENFNKTIQESNTPVLVDFWADWCGPCKMLGPVLEEMDSENLNLTIGKVNVDNQPELAAEFQVMSIPTVLLFQNGKNVGKFVGFQSKDAVKDFVTTSLK